MKDWINPESMDSQDFTYTNVNIMRIKRMIRNSDFYCHEFTSEEIVQIAVDILRIMVEIPFGNGCKKDDLEWQMLFNWHKSRDGIHTLMIHLLQNGKSRNNLFNEVLDNGNKDDLIKMVRILCADEGDD